ncbi:MAG: hypothetical protein RIC35_07700 [Marinoscillum sp.]
MYLKSVMLSGLLLLTMTGYSQKGVGESVGVSRQRLNTDVIELNGTVTRVEVEPCKYTTGKSVSSTHLMVETDNGTVLNIHLGSTTEVSEMVADIEGKEIRLMAFRTNKLPEGHYIGKELSYNGKEIVLRDEALKPFWAGKTGRENKRKWKNN